MTGTRRLSLDSSQHLQDFFKSSCQFPLPAVVCFAAPRLLGLRSGPRLADPSFNMLLSQGSFPAAVWKSAIVTPILKAGKNASLRQSYRPVALLSCLSKVLERLVHDQLSSFRLESKALPDDQFVFRSGRSAEWQLLSVVERWHRALDQRHLIHAVFLDVAKAFDRVDHRLLLQSFYSLGV